MWRFLYYVILFSFNSWQVFKFIFCAANIPASSRETYCSSYRIVGSVCLGEGIPDGSLCLGRSMRNSLLLEENALYSRARTLTKKALLSQHRSPSWRKHLYHFVAWFGFGLGFWTRSKPRLLVVLEVEAKEIGGAQTDPFKQVFSVPYRSHLPDPRTQRLESFNFPWKPQLPAFLQASPWILLLYPFNVF